MTEEDSEWEDSSEEEDTRDIITVNEFGNNLKNFHRWSASDQGFLYEFVFLLDKLFQQQIASYLIPNGLKVMKMKLVSIIMIV